MHHAHELRRMAAECLAVALTTSAPSARVSLLSMAQKLVDLADGLAILLEFDAQEMSRHQLLP
jgi:hypothetical protein